MSALLDSLATGFEGYGVRREALDAAVAGGVPSTRIEQWKYTSLRALDGRSFVASAALLAQPDATLLAGIPAPRIVFVNGTFDAGLSDFAALPEGVVLRSLGAALAEGDPRETAFLARRFDGEGATFSLLNAALSQEGVVLRVAEDVHADKPLHLVFIGAAATADTAWHLRNMVELRRGAAISIVEHHLAMGEHAHFANALTHAHLATGARLRHAHVQDEASGATSIARTDAVLARDATYQRLDLELGSGLSRHELNVRLEGVGARVEADGVQLADGRRHLDTRLCVEHIARDTACDLLWRALAADRGRAVLHGGITIRAGADGSDARLSSRNLLLSAGAEIDAQPVLEIHADEVKAAHGAAVGRLDEGALFYLRSRGIPADEARRMMTAAFCREALRVVEDDALRATLTGRLDAAIARLGAAA